MARPGSFTPTGTGSGDAVQAAGERGLGLALQHLLTESRREAPIEEGTLERSGRVSQDGTRGAVSYSTPYAVIQHEAMDFRHDQGRKAKYLEDPMNREARVVGQIIATAIREALQ